MEHLPPGTSGRETTATGNGEHTNGNGGERQHNDCFEDNVYRGTYRGIGKAIEAAMEGMYGEICNGGVGAQYPQLCITLSDKVITEYKEKQITIGEVYRQMGISYDTDEAMEVLKRHTGHSIHRQGK